MTLPHRPLHGAAVALLILFATTANAHLGGDAASVSADRAVMGGELRSTAVQPYTLHEISSDAGTVREYLGADGKVFAVSWVGVRPPDLRQLFGDYYQRFQDAAASAVRARPGMQRELRVTQSDFVAHSSGHLRAFHGSAYLPGLVPAGVDLSELQ